MINLVQKGSVAILKVLTDIKFKNGFTKIAIKGGRVSFRIMNAYHSLGNIKSWDTQSVQFLQQWHAEPHKYEGEIHLFQRRRFIQYLNFIAYKKLFQTKLSPF